MRKCSIDCDLRLMGMNGGSAYDPDTFFCVDIKTKKIAFKHSAYGRYSHHWITINDQKYLSLQTTKTAITYFRVSDGHQFEEDDTMKIVLGDDDEINYCEYDQSFEHIYIVRNKCILEKRSVNNLSEVVQSIKLENKIGFSGSKLFALSNDGKYCVIGGGDKSFFYIISLDSHHQFKLNANNLSRTLSPCFIDGDSNLLTIGGYEGEGLEIWSVADRKMVHHIMDNEHFGGYYVASAYSTNGILAVGYAKYRSKQNY